MLHVKISEFCMPRCCYGVLSGAYFNAVELSKIATELDEAERTTLVEGAMDEASLEHIIKQPSSNMDDSGFFSGQVGLTIMPEAYVA